MEGLARKKGKVQRAELRCQWKVPPRDPIPLSHEARQRNAAKRKGVERDHEKNPPIGGGR